MADEPKDIPEPRYRRVTNWDRLGENIAQLYAEAKRLVELAAHGRTDNGDQLDRKTAELGLKVIPEPGLLHILTPGAHPQLTTTNDFAAHIPWEAIQERYMICPQKHTSVRVAEEETRYCSGCGKPMKFVVSRLSLIYQLSHLVHGQQPALPRGREFLFIEDPLEDLCSEQNDHEGLCRTHLETLRSNLEAKGFNILQLSREAATRRQVCGHLERNNIAGLYYSGHGLYDRVRNEACLRLADGPIFASEIVDIAPAIPFVFLNGCYSAKPGSDWVVERKPRSVAGAFARKARVVIAPIFPVLNADAAQFAERVFASAIEDELLGEAVTEARRDSLARFEEGAQPDICWMAYRFFGNPNSTLWVPREYISLPPDPTREPIRRVFDDNGDFNLEFFGFAAEEVFARAGRRRAWQGRTLVTTTDLIAGLLRKGELTRTLMRQSHKDPDRAYRNLLKTKEDDPPNTSPRCEQPLEAQGEDDGIMTLKAFLRQPEEQLRKLIEKGMIRNQNECVEQLVEVLTKADESSQLAGGDNVQLISERNVLENLLDTGNWPTRAIDGFPSVSEMKGHLQDVLQEGHFDDNGVMRLEILDRAARKIIDTAHTLSQQCGACPIPNRLLLAAFLTDDEGYMSRLLEGYGQNPKLHLSLLIASVRKRHSLTFGLGLEACSRAVLPILDHSKKSLGSDETVTEQALFRAFCQVAPPDLKKSLMRGPFPIDLDYLKQLEPLPPVVVQENFAESGWAVVRRAGEIAGQEGSSTIRTRHLLAAMLNSTGGHTNRYLQSYELDISQVSKALIDSTSVHTEAAASVSVWPSFTFNARSILSRSVRLAMFVREGSGATEEDIFYASLANWDVLVGSVKGIKR